MFLTLTLRNAKPVSVNMSQVRYILPDPDGSELVFEWQTDRDDFLRRKDTLIVTEAPQSNSRVHPTPMNSLEDSGTDFKQGDKVHKVGGDYIFQGVVVAVFTKLSGAIRYVVEDDRGVLHVYSNKNLARRW